MQMVLFVLKISSQLPAELVGFSHGTLVIFCSRLVVEQKTQGLIGAFRRENPKFVQNHQTRQNKNWPNNTNLGQKKSRDKGV